MMRMTTSRAFLLRVWPPTQNSEVGASVADVDTGEVHPFAALDRLHEWLRVTAGPEEHSRPQQPPSPTSR